MKSSESSLFYPVVLTLGTAILSSAVTTLYISSCSSSQGQKQKSIKNEHENPKETKTEDDHGKSCHDNNIGNHDTDVDELNYQTPIDRSDIYSVKHDLAFIHVPSATTVNNGNSNELKDKNSTPTTSSPITIPMWVADMDIPIAPYIQKRLRQRSNHPIGVGYTLQPTQGWEAMVDWIRYHHDWKTLTVQDMIFSSSVVTSFANIVREFTTKGAAILAMTPLFNPLQNVITQCQRTLIQHPLTLKSTTSATTAHQQYCIDFDLLQEQVDTHKVKILLLCNPHNPSGRVWTKLELQRVVDICTRRNIVMVSDEIWCDWVLRWSPSKYIPLASLVPSSTSSTMTAPTPRCITLLGPGKTWNLAGLHCSAVIIQHEETRKRYQSYVEPAFLHFGSAFATEALLSYKDEHHAYYGAANDNDTGDGVEVSKTTHKNKIGPRKHQGQEWLERTKDHVEENIELLMEFCHKINNHTNIQSSSTTTATSTPPPTTAKPPKLQVIRPDSTYLVWIDCSGMKYPSQTQQLFAQKAGVVVSHGNEFSPTDTNNFIRMNVACSRQILEQAFEQILQYVIQDT